MSSPTANQPERHDSLPPGTRLEEFEIRGLIGVGGFGIVYLAYDHLLHREVALKEYMPASLASRSQGVTVTVSSSRNVAAFEDGRRSFVNEARLLARFDHVSLVKVLRFWEANGTAYMVMPYYRGRTLKDVVAEAGPLPEPRLRAVLSTLMDALEVLHAAGCYHRDITPDNIQILDGGRPLLLDFGAARRVIADLTQDLTVILKPGYAPIEQYAFGSEAQQGPWTDVYALAAVTRFCATGKAPPPAPLRAVEDRMEPLSTASSVRLSTAFCVAVDRALAIKAKDRLQSIAEFRSALGTDSVPSATAPPASATKARASVADPATTDQGDVAAPAPASAAAPTDAAPSSTRTRVLRAALMTLAGGALVIGGVAYYVTSMHPDAAVQSAVPQVPARPAPATPEAPSTALSQTPTVATPAIADSSPVSVATQPAAAPTGSGAAASLYDEAQILHDLANASAPTWTVSVSIPRASIRINRDQLLFKVSSNRPGYLYVLMLAPDGKSIRLLFPNDFDTDNSIPANTPVNLPRQNWQMRASGPPGTNLFAALVTPSPRDFSSIGIARRKPFVEFDRIAAAREFATHGPTAFAGTPIGCRLLPSDCALHGAATFEVTEVPN